MTRYIFDTYGDLKYCSPVLQLGQLDESFHFIKWNNWWTQPVGRVRPVLGRSVLYLQSPGQRSKVQLLPSNKPGKFLYRTETDYWLNKNWLYFKNKLEKNNIEIKLPIKVNKYPNIILCFYFILYLWSYSRSTVQTLQTFSKSRKI